MKIKHLFYRLPFNMQHWLDGHCSPSPVWRLCFSFTNFLLVILSDSCKEIIQNTLLGVYFTTRLFSSVDFS